MTVNLGLLIVAGALAACGVYMLMERSLIKMLFGLMLAGNGINLLIVILSGPPGNPPIRGRETAGQTSNADPLAQGMVLTAIVITMGVAAFVLALTYRLYVINRSSADTPEQGVEPPLAGAAPASVDDFVQDDTEDVKIAKASLNQSPDRDRSDDPSTGADTRAGDYFDDRGNPMTAEEFAAAHRGVIETDLMPEDVALLARLNENDDMPDEDGDSPDDQAQTDGPDGGDR